MLRDISDKLRSLNPWHFLWITILLSEIFTFAFNSIQSYLLWGFISHEVLHIGIIDALVVPLVVAPIIIYFVRKTEEIARKNEQLQREIDKRRKLAEDLRKEKTFIENALNVLNETFTVFDIEGTLLRWNQTVKTVTGYSDEEISSMKPTDFFLEDEKRRVIQAIETAVKTGHTTLETVISTKDGHQIPYEFSGSLLKDDEENVLGICATGTDISERKEAEREIAHDITERYHAQQRIERQLQRLTSQRDIDMAITSSFDVRVTIKVILDEVLSQLSVDAADILLFNPSTQTLEYAESRGFRSNALKHTCLKLGEGYAGRAVLEKRTVRIQDLSEEENGFKRSPLLANEEFVEYFAVPLIARGRVNGVLEIFNRSFTSYDQEWLDFLEAFGLQAAIAVDNAEMFNKLERSNIELALAYDLTLEGWSKALDFRDKETEGHCQRVTDLAVKMARAMGMDDKELVHMRRGALLHDIGKLGVRDSILLKPDKLTVEEWVIMKKHPTIAYEILSPISFLKQALDVPYCHHEKWDGSGYPRGLKGEQIPLAARIFAVVDVWDALRSDRPYRTAWPEEKAAEYILRQAGIHFDAEIVKTCLNLLRSV